MKLFLLLLPLAVAFFISCSPVEPWQKGALAKDHMQFDTDSLETKFRLHVEQSKEASFGGYGTSAGGCGCN
jgi:hypothetical protein